MLKFNLHNELDKKDHFLNTTFDSVDEFMDWMDEDYDKFVDEMETSREDWSGVHDFTSKYENGVAFVGYSSYEIKNFEAALNKWKEYFKSRGKLHDNSSVSKVKVTTNDKQQTAVDYFGNQINVGDTVAFMQTGYRQLMDGVVVNITDKTVIIDHEKTNVGKTQTKQFHNQVIVKILTYGGNK